MKSKRWLILLAVLLVAGVCAWVFFSRAGQRNGGPIRVSGNIEVIDAEVSFKIAGRVEQRLVDEGQMVEKGACVAVLDAADLTADLAMRQADLAGAQSQLAELEAGSRPAEIEAAKARLASAKADNERLETDFRSGQQLLEKKVISDEEFVHRKTLFEAAVARAREAEEQLKLVQEGPRKEQIDQARARVEQAKAAVTLAQTRLGYSRVAAPFAGMVLSKNVEPGEYVAAGTPIVTLGALREPWLRAYVNETDLGRIKPGQRVLVTTDTYPGKRYQGRISFIASQAEFTPKNVQTQKERVKLVYRIKIEIPNPNLELKPGMPADAEIQVSSGPADHAGD